MPKLGLKCFLGSFLLSLVAVFVATKAYIILSVSEKNAEVVHHAAIMQPRNIELFAATEENDPLYEKFNSLDSQKNDDMRGLADESADEILSVQENSDDVLYDNSDNDVTDIAESAVEPVTEISANDYVDVIQDVENNDDDSLQIADAATAPSFTIPLIHHFKTAAGTVTVSDQASGNQIAMASHDVSVDNLGADAKDAAAEEIISGISDETAEIEPQKYDDPWEVAETANKHTSKNSINAYKAEHSSDISAMDQSDTKEVAENNQVPYKMQKNLLVPIPEEIMSETDMTPQFSTSEENKKIEADLRAKNVLPAQKESSANADSSVKNKNTVVILDEDEDEDADEDKETSKTLTESIAEWFSGNKDKQVKSGKDKKSDSQSNRDQSNSIFKKLLGIGNDNVTPTELKLAFQPNRAEISGQTLEWLHAFSDNAVKYENVLVEIRISKTAPYDLQQKRLKLLYRILANNGVEYNKVNIIFTDREPNSFIIRNVRYATEEEQQKAIAAKEYSPWY